MARALALLIILLITAYCWLRVFSKTFRSKNRIWWLSLARSKETDEESQDRLDLMVSLAGAVITTAVFIYIAGLGYLWK